jgi:hypothetical protein
VTSEIRLSRDLTTDALALGDGIAATLVRRIPDATEYDYFDGLVSTIGILIALDAAGPDLAVARLLDLATRSPTGPCHPGRVLRCGKAALQRAESRRPSPQVRSEAADRPRRVAVPKSGHSCGDL